MYVVCMYVCTYMYVCLRVLCVSTDVCMYVCMHVCMHCVCMYDVSMCICCRRGTLTEEFDAGALGLKFRSLTKNPKANWDFAKYTKTRRSQGPDVMGLNLFAEILDVILETCPKGLPRSTLLAQATCSNCFGPTTSITQKLASFWGLGCRVQGAGFRGFNQRPCCRSLTSRTNRSSARPTGRRGLPIALSSC